MGAWGIGYYEDDTALDFAAAIEEAEDPKAVIAGAFDSYEDAAIIVAATYIDRQVNGTLFTPADYDGALDVDSFPQRNPNVDLSDLKAKAVAGLEQVLDEDSDLAELWAETDEFEDWKSGIELLLARLEG